jgi:hypothetical protein
VKAAVGDRITVHGLHVGDATRCGEVLEVKGAGGEPPFVVRWDDGHEAVFVPGSGVRVDPADAAAAGEPTRLTLSERWPSSARVSGP